MLQSTSDGLVELARLVANIPHSVISFRVSNILGLRQHIASFIGIRMIAALLSDSDSGSIVQRQ